MVARASRASVRFCGASRSCSRPKRAPQTRSSRKQQSSPPPDNTITSAPPAPTTEVSIEQQEASSPVVPPLSRLSSESSALIKGGLVIKPNNMPTTSIAWIQTALPVFFVLSRPVYVHRGVGGVQTNVSAVSRSLASP